MYLTDLIRRSLRNLLSAKTRTLLTAFAIAVGTFALTLTLGASNGAQAYVNKVITDNFDPTELTITNDPAVFGSSDTSKPKVYNGNYGTIGEARGASVQVKRLSDADLARLKAVPGVESVRTANTVSLQYVTRDGQKKYVGTVEPLSPSQNPDLTAGKLTHPLGSKRILLPQGFLSALGFKNAQDALGKPIRLAVQRTATGQSILQQLSSGTSLSDVQSGNTTQETVFTVAGVVKTSVTAQPGTELYMFADAGDVTALNDYATEGTPDFHQYLVAYAKVKDGTNSAKLNATQAKIKALGYGAQSVEDTQKFLTQIINVLQGIVTAFGFIAVVASLFGIVNTMYISVLQRTREIGLMKALGMRKRDITQLFRIEASLIGLLGGLLGSLGAVGLGTALNPWITTKLGLGKQHLLLFKTEQIVVLVVALMIVATVAGLLPARKASRLNPIDALRTE